MVFLLGAVVVFFFIPGLPIKDFIQKTVATYRLAVYTGYQNYYDQAAKTAVDFKKFHTDVTNPVIMVQLESLNSEFISPKITPEMYGLAQQGILFEHHHSDGIQTHRAMESILCSALPSLATSSFNTGEPLETVAGPQINCLPRLLHAAGYKTILFQNYDLSFQHIDDFGNLAGFDEMHADEIMHPDDPHLNWAWREDVYFHRVAEFLAAHEPHEKLFVYIVTGATNHFPFETDNTTVREDVFARRPYPNTTDYAENRANAAFAQDAYLGDFTQAFGALDYFKSSHVFIYGDHPIGIFRENKSFSLNVESIENKHFYTGLLYLPPQDQQSEIKHGVVTQDLGTSHRFTGPTILELLKLPNPYPFSYSYLSSMKAPDAAKSFCAVDVQPFFNVAIGLTQYPYKISVNFIPHTIEYIDLRTNVGSVEKPTILDHSLKKASQYIEACLQQQLKETITQLSGMQLQ